MSRRSFLKISALLGMGLTGGALAGCSHDESLRDVPLAQTTPDAWADYDTVLFGYPIWWAIAAWPCDHFATDNDFTGKRVVPFCTSSSSGLGQSGKLLAQAAGTGSWERGQRFSSGASDDEVRSWARGL